MAKKSLIIFIILLCALGAAGLYYPAKKYFRPARQAKPIPKPEEVTLRFVEGWTIQDIGEYLSNDQKRESLPHIITVSEFLAAQKKYPLTNYPILASKPAGASLEGFLFPDSYRFFVSSLSTASGTPEEIANAIIKKMLDNFNLKFTSEMQAQAVKQNLSVYKIITLASIIEKETGASETEKKTVASIFYNRLKAGMPLQSDATVNYVTKKNVAAPSEADTKVDSLYNTYQHQGLPPGPICNPSLASIMAALYPGDNDYMYFLHDQKTGQAFYAKTYDEHLANKQKYLK
ncbi:MAG: endolytic transglycosylase MltG [Candidatus Doudnabacteria bacterium]|nr:endolytic transglycosylase MltG [Candidatus Doudnabacteria bacterium]